MHMFKEERKPRRLALVGDMGGHLVELVEALWGLGVDPDLVTMPADLVVVQVGDLVHRGPDSAGVVRLVDALMTAYPSQWVQLLGNHEACHLGGPLFLHDELDPVTVATLERWYAEGQLGLGVALDTEVGPVLVTHAGLTYELWQQLGSPSTPSAAVTALNSRPDLAWRPGRMLGDTTGTGGVLWAEAADELYASWLRAERDGVSAPFAQVHGHSSAYRWGVHRASGPDEVASRLVVDEARRHVRVTLAGGAFVGIDPCFGAHSYGRWAPLLLTGSKPNDG